jgi:WD40 repeat protein
MRQLAMVVSPWSHQWACTAFDATPDLRLIVIGCNDGSVSVWHAAGGQLQRVLRAHTSAVWAVRLSADGRELVSGGLDGVVRVWGVGDGHLRHELEPDDDWSDVMDAEGPSPVQDVVLAAGGTWLAAGARDGAVHVFDRSTGARLRSLTGVGDWVGALASDPGERVVVCGDWRGDLHVWDVESGRRRLHASDELCRPILCLALTEDGDRICCGRSNGSVSVHDRATGRVLLDWQGHEDGVNAIEVLDGGRVLVSASADGMRAWTPTGSLLAEADDAGEVIALSPASDGLSFLTLAPDGGIRGWAVATISDADSCEGTN